MATQRGEDARAEAATGDDRVEHAIAEAPHRGRDATAPHHIPLAGWKDVLWRVKDEIDEDRIGMISAAVAFFATLSLFPAAIAAISVYGLVVTPDEARRQIEGLAAVLPYEARTVLGAQLEAIVGSAPSSLGWGVVIGLVGALWSASNGTSQLMSAIGIAYDEPDERSFLKQRALALGLTLAFLVGLLIALALIAVAPAVLARVGLEEGVEEALVLARWPLLALLAMAGLSVLYAVAPHRRRAKWRWVTWGAVLASVLWLLGSALFSFFVSRFGSYGETYGAIAGVVVLMTWLQLSAFAVLLGAELNAEIEAQTAIDSTVGAPRPMGERGAQKADVLGRLR